MAAASGDRMQVEEADSTLSSSPISSAPVSPRNNGSSDTIAVASALHDRGGLSSSAPATNAPPQSDSTSNAAQPDKPKRQRKKKELGPDGKSVDDGKPKVTKPRKPREPKPAVNGAVGGAPKRKIKSEADSTPRQSTITEMVNTYTPAATPQRQSEPSAPSTLPVPPPLPASIPRPATSGLKYDPIRGMTMDAYVRPPPVTSNSTNASPVPPVNRASASPAIASLIDPPSLSTSTTSAARLPQSALAQPAATTPRQSLSIEQSLASPVVVKVQPAESVETMDVDETSPAAKLGGKDKLAADAKAQSKASSTAHTPKANAGRSSPPAHKGTGSGLLSTSDLFGGSSSGDGGERKMINIDIEIKLNPNGGNHINVAQEIIKKYGRDAINPRAAAHRERLMQVMAAANKIEGNSADDMSIDLMSDIGDDSNIEMGGMDDGSAADGDKPRKRRKKVEEYDLDDEFIDDTELAWQQQAAVAKDGFFVYSGPLIPEGETARVETAAAARGRGGRGRGRGKAGGSSTTHASLAEKKENIPTTTTARGRGRGSKTPAAPRKRATKAEKEKLEAEKTAKTVPSTAPLPPPLPVPPPTQIPLNTASAGTA